jgi:short chain dehydrogenase
MWDFSLPPSVLFLLCFFILVFYLYRSMATHSQINSATSRSDGTTPERSVLVTGASAGSIGSAMVLAFARREFLVFATARNLSRIEPSIANHANVRLIELDVTSQASIDSARNTVAQVTGGRLDFLVNNAGAGYTTPLVDFDQNKGKMVFEVNFWGVLNMTKAFMPLLVEAKATVVNISSVGAVVHTPWIGKSMTPASNLYKGHDSQVLVLIPSPFLSLYRNLQRLESGLDLRLGDPPPRARPLRRQGGHRHGRIHRHQIPQQHSTLRASRPQPLPAHRAVHPGHRPG